MAETPVEVAPAEGQATSPPETSGQGPWYTAPDGTAFASADELSRKWNDMLMMRKAFTQKTQEHAQNRRTLDEERKRFDLDRQEYLERRKEIERFDRLVRERPDVYKQLKKALESGPSPDVITERIRQEFEEQYGSKLKEMERWRAEQEAREARDRAYAELTAEYEDFDGDDIEKAITDLTEQLQSGNARYLAETLYWAGKGRPKPDAIKDKEKKQAQLMPSSHREAKSSGRKFKSVKEAEEAALREMKGG